MTTHQQQLDQQADLIEAVLAQHRTPARVTGGNVMPRWVQFLMQPAAGVKANRIEALSVEIAQALGATSVKVIRSGGAIRIDVPRSDPQVVELGNLIKRLPVNRIPAHTAVLGLADDGAPLLVRLPSAEVGHVLISGGVGTGKTSLIVAMLFSLAWLNHRHNLQIVLSGRGLDGVRGLPHVLDWSLADVTMLLERRMAAGIDAPRVIVAIDDLGTVDRTLIDRFIADGCAAGVHVIGATIEDSSIKCRVKITADHAPGDFVARYSGGLEMRFNAAYADVDAIARLIAEAGKGR